MIDTVHQVLDSLSHEDLKVLARENSVAIPKTKQVLINRLLNKNVQHGGTIEEDALRQQEILEAIMKSSSYGDIESLSKVSKPVREAMKSSKRLRTLTTDKKRRGKCNIPLFFIAIKEHATLAFNQHTPNFNITLVHNHVNENKELYQARKEQFMEWCSKKSGRGWDSYDQFKSRYRWRNVPPE
jgi:hypothetical protein